MLSEQAILDYVAELKEKSLTSVGEAQAEGFEELVEEMAAGHLLPAKRQRLRPVKTGAHAKCVPRNPQPELLRIFKLSNAIFLIIHQNTNPLRIDVKCDFKLAKHLSARYETVQKSKLLGNKGIELILTGQLSVEDVKDLIAYSFHHA